MPLTYCLNVHPGESWAENMAALRTTVLAVRDLVSPGESFGLGLRLGARAARELDTPAGMNALRRFLDSQNLHVFTINGFPYGRFHGPGVKENVYAPDWRSPERRDYTNRLASILAHLIPGGATGTISTVPCSWKPWITEPAQLDAMAALLRESAAYCADLAAATDREIVVTLEPEPGCLLETTPEAIAFFTERLFAGSDTARRHLGICLDTCHAALQFEEPLENLRRYRAAGIRVPKIQLSSALSTDASPDALAALREFDEPVYMHQTKARRAGGSILSWNDLPEALAALPSVDAEEVRVHFHVPLHFEGNVPLRSTASLITREFLDEIRDEHVEIETYTWDVLPAGLRAGGIERSIAAEFEWVKKISR